MSAKGWKAVGWLWLGLLAATGVIAVMVYVAEKFTPLVFFAPLVVALIVGSVLVYRGAAREGE